MIHIIPTQKTKFRTFGWVQDPGNFRSLCDVVAIFQKGSQKYLELKQERLPRLVEERDGRAQLLEALDAEPLYISYGDLVGSAFSPRSASRCNGIVQAVVPGQGRPFIVDWPADNFVRWAYALGFLKYDHEGDSFFISESGVQLTKARTTGRELNQNEKEILITAILAYPPAVRVLTLLAQTEDTHLTKFEIGRQLGFVGEGGFTSLPQSILIRSLAMTEQTKERNKMKTDWDGSSDKYARMIASWLVKLGLMQQIPKEITVTVAGQRLTETIGQAYMITAAGLMALNRVSGRSRHSRIAKNLCFEMMATKGKDREYLRIRRTYILKVISEGTGSVCLEDIRSYLMGKGLAVSPETIEDDIQGLINIGLNIQSEGQGYLWKDAINDFVLPLPQELTKSDLMEQKEELRLQLTHLSHEYLSLLDLAYDSAQNRLFEMKTMELLMEGCGYSGTHLGGSRKPDGICYTTDLEENYGIIVDTKAYSKGYSLPVSQADEMERYIRENLGRDSAVNENQWWNHFPSNIKTFFFLFIAGHFKGNYQNQIERLQRSTKVKGGAAEIKRLLLAANGWKAGSKSHETIRREIFGD